MGYQVRVDEKELFEVAVELGKPWLVRTEQGDLYAHEERRKPDDYAKDHDAYCFGGRFVLPRFKQVCGVINANDMLEYIEVMENHKKTRREVMLDRWGGMTSNGMADFFASLSGDGGGLYGYKKNADVWETAYTEQEAAHGWAVYLDGYPRKDELE